MCGIAGFYTSMRHDAYTNVLESMIDAIHHRGPDADSTQVITSGEEGIIGLGHKRLSIIDLSENGKQPMTSTSGKSTIVFNGEIYNYQPLREQLIQEGWSFRTQTDTEVILNLYEKHGEDCLHYFNGMFAFAIYDHVRDQLFMARDRLGIRPLFYKHEPGTAFIFASEIKSIFQFPGARKAVNRPALAEYTSNRYVSNPETVYDGVMKLEPGMSLTLRGEQITKRKYWDITHFEKWNIPFDEALSRLDELMQDSVRLRMISDVPVGAYLSGGLDSSLIVALMAQNSSMPINTFSVGLENSQYNELGYAKAVADLYKTNHHEFVINPQDFRDSLYQVVHFRDAPSSETADIPMLLMSMQAKKKVSVVLTGEGCDELFGGYPKYAYDRLTSSALGKMAFNNPLIARIVNTLPYSFRKAKLAYNSLSIPDDVKRYKNWFASFSEAQTNSLLSEEYKLTYLNQPAGEGPIIHGLTNLDRMQYFDMRYWLTDNLLERGDRTMMAASIEGRLPFLDYRVAELAFRLKESYKIKGFNRKYIVKQLASKYLPAQIINRKKIGFYMPIADWFRNEMKDFVTDHLLSSTFFNRGIFNKDKIKELVKAHMDGVTNHEKEIWMLLNLEIWFRSSIDRGLHT
ncbi:asparagine synthase (glutamine-hydrolyzing) [Paenibacillus sp. R14(2021)]|uniref:asparagine synthase (glutamine-hydrolyzing) n=1 Tax=Paenibacillus sp. R14(2021) TaxID=2859228 RepID=UPI001C611B19|nr:asparagine synthase (glutamine-hydrolyzing) [Paenibacillus sp. R14(2021)]